MAATQNAAEAEIVDGLPPGWGDGLGGRIAFGIAVAFSAFQLVTAAYAFLPSQVSPFLPEAGGRLARGR